MEYGMTLFQFADPQAILGAIAAAGLLVWTWLCRSRRPLVFFSVGWFFLWLLPVSNLYPVNAYMAEHWLYLPCIGAFLAVMDAFSLERRKLGKTFTGALAAGLLIFYASLTAAHNN